MLQDDLYPVLLSRAVDGPSIEPGPNFVWVRGVGAGLGVVTSVPSPVSGLRFGDLISHGLEQRELVNAHGVSVKGPLQDARVRSSETATWSVTVFGASEVDLDHLGDLALARGLGADVWDGAGTSGDVHDLARGACIPTGRPTEVGVTLGLAGSRRDVEALMSDFEQDRRYVSCLDLVEMVTGIERE